MRSKGIGKIELVIWTGGILLATFIAFSLGLESSLLMIFPIILIVAFFGFQVWLTIFLGDNYPNRLWLGILLSFVFCPWGQLYLEKPGIYIVLLFISCGIFNVFINDIKLAVLLTGFLSCTIMYYRFNKLQSVYSGDNMKKSELGTEPPNDNE